MVKPKIIILIHYLEIGGAEMSLIGLLNALDPNKVDVDLFVYSHRGPLMQYIPGWVNLLPEINSYSLIESPIKDVIKRGYYHIAGARLLAKIKHKLYRKHDPNENKEDASLMQLIGNTITPLLPAINPTVEYDLCISFLTPHNIGKDKIKAKKKIAWIHTDYSNVYVNVNLDLKKWSAYDHIISIAPKVTENFLRTYPSLSNKIKEIENILSPNFIKSRAELYEVPEEILPNPKGVNLLSLGRFSYAKNFDNIPLIAKEIVNNGISNLKWYIIGYGEEERLIRSCIKNAGMENHVIILGKRENPYPYIKSCDIYVQPSRFEGKSITVREAQILGKPVVVANFPTAKSQINEGIDGIILPSDNVSFAKGLTEFIYNRKFQKELSQNCVNTNFSNETEVDKIYNILNL